VSETDIQSDIGNDRILVIVNYVLCFLAVGGGLTLLLAAIIAYLRKDGASQVMNSHYRYQIATFWYGLAICIIGLLTIWFFGLGFLVWALAPIWLIIKAAVGLIRLLDGRAHENPTSFLF
jgi:uncharacterized membrane protein